MTTLSTKPLEVDYTSKDSLRILCMALQSVRDRAEFCVDVLLSDLFVIEFNGMNVKDLVADFPDEMKKQILMHSFSVSGFDTEDLFRKVLSHIVDGRDQFDMASAGGLSNEEIVKLCEIAKNYNVYIAAKSEAKPIPTGVTLQDVLSKNNPISPSLN